MDALKRELNTLQWPYFAATMKNEVNKVCLVASEALMISEREDGYKFLIKATLEMAPKRKAEDIYIVSGDGFSSQRSLINWGLPRAKFIADYWHFFESG